MWKISKLIFFSQVGQHCALEVGGAEQRGSKGGREIPGKGGLRGDMERWRGHGRPQVRWEPIGGLGQNKRHLPVSPRLPTVPTYVGVDCQNR